MIEVQAERTTYECCRCGHKVSHKVSLPGERRYPDEWILVNVKVPAQTSGNNTLIHRLFCAVCKGALVGLVTDFSVSCEAKRIHGKSREARLEKFAAKLASMDPALMADKLRQGGFVMEDEQ